MKTEGKLEEEKGVGEPPKTDSEEMVSFAANEAPISPRESELLNKLATKLCHNVDFSKTLSSDLLQANVFNKLVQRNLSALLANAPLQISNCNHVNGTDSC